MLSAISRYSAIKKTSDFRMDADYFTHLFRDRLLHLRTDLTFSTLQQETNFIGSGHTPYKHDVSIGNVPFITVECIGDMEFHFNKTKRITRDQFSHEFKKMQIGQGAVVCTIKRRICKAYPFISCTEKMAVNQDVALLLPGSRILPGFLAAYLNSAYGQGFGDSLKTEQMNPYISLVNLSKIPIPLINIEYQESVERVILAAQTQALLSGQAYQQAQEILLSELGLSNWQPKHSLTFVKNYSAVDQAGRIDAEYFQPKYDEIVKAIKSYPGGWDTLGNLIKVKDKNWEPEDKIAYKYIELSNIAGNGEITDCMLELGSDLPSRARRKVAVGDVIVSSIEGSLSSIALIGKEYDQSLCSTGFYVINSKIFNSATLLVLLKSYIGQLQLKKGCSGTILTAINKDEFNKIILPKVAVETQSKIELKVTESFNLRKQSKHLLECAKQAVEMAIEQDEDKAMKWLQKNVGEV